jgi:enoyl-CoA hydratase
LDDILFDVMDRIGLVTINRPKVLNAISVKTLEELKTVIMEVSSDRNIHVLVITGAGEKAFVAGADITDFPKMNSLQAKLYSEMGQDVFFQLERLPIPVIACVNGFALGGGCELAMSCDFIYASEKARFGQPEINLGILPGFGGTQRLSRLIGRARAKELCMTGALVTAQQAYDYGLISKIFPPDRLLEETMKTAKALAAKSHSALRAVKQVIDCGSNVDLRSGCAFEAEALGVLFSGRDKHEGVSAYLEKREPVFAGTFES